MLNAGEGSGGATVVGFYAVNGIGFGHVARLLAIAEEFRRLARRCELPILPFFLTSSDGEQKASLAGFPTFKFPSEHGMVDVGSSVDFEYRQIVSRALLRVLETVSPDLFVVDGSPIGAFGELAPTDSCDPLAQCRRRVFIYRPVRSEIANNESFRCKLLRYNRILVPEEANAANCMLDIRGLAQAEFVGPVFNCPAHTLRDRAIVRKELGIAEEEYSVYVSTGGGGHPEAELRLKAICDSLREMPDTHLLVGAGPLYRGARVRGRNIDWFSDHSATQLMVACDVAVSAAGYNSFHELMYLGIPTVFVPLPTKADDQWKRAERAEQKDAGRMLMFSDIGVALRPIIELWRNPGVREKLKQNARLLVPANGAQVAAGILLNFVTESAIGRCC